jgi:hypothetical protein
VEGEPEAIFPFLGSSRLEEPIERYGASLVVHGHAHYGTLDGATRSGIHVHNVSLPLLRHNGCEQPFRVFEIEAAPSSDELAAPVARGERRRES